MEVIHELLGIPKLKIVQDDTLNPFSIDSQILASFVTIKKDVKNILDLGTGNAPIPLYLTLRTSAKICGIELQSKIYELGEKSVKINMKEEQITLICDDLKNISSYYKTHSFDVVVSNPPFFKVNPGSNVNPSEELSIARHEIKVTLDEVIKTASLMLKPNGIFSLVHRPERINDIIEAMRKYKIEPKRIRFVYPSEDKDANQVLVEGVYLGKENGTKVLKPLYIHPKYEENKDEILNIYNGKIKE